MIDLIIAQPWISQNQLATHFGLTASWVSTIIASDAFQASLAARKDELVDPVLRATIEEQFKGLVSRSLELLRIKLAAPTVADNLVIKTLEISSRALGYGARVEAPAAAPLDRHLEIIGDRLTQLLVRKKAESLTIEGEFANGSP